MADMQREEQPSLSEQINTLCAQVANLTLKEDPLSIRDCANHVCDANEELECASDELTTILTSVLERASCDLISVSAAQRAIARFQKSLEMLEAHLLTLRNLCLNNSCCNHSLVQRFDSALYSFHSGSEAFNKLQVDRIFKEIRGGLTKKTRKSLEFGLCRGFGQNVVPEVFLVLNIISSRTLPSRPALSACCVEVFYTPPFAADPVHCGIRMLSGQSVW
ncbi:hypothetical protein Pelo_8834 [Pelomyxa schiedti]|nr:hypothetical protein Pelo_8834 [Pelomyxa schiedti]